MLATDSLVLSLHECGDGAQAAIGTKAHNLARLLSAGFQVPPGVVVTSRAFSTWLALTGEPADPKDRGKPPVPSDVERAVLEAVGILGSGPFAVRSSSIAEDLAQASYAGQYETVLDVRGREEILAALVQCWSSALETRVLAYRGVALGRLPAMAVLIQQLVPAAAAGVAFTVDPITGDRSVTLVSAVRGLGERLVSGAASPDEWVIKDGAAMCRRNAEQAITSDTAIDIARLARRVEAFFGVAIDIEWALADGRLYLLQARPVTALPTQPRNRNDVGDIDHAVPPPGFWRRDTTHQVRPHSPMNRSVLLPPMNSGLRRSFAEFGILAEGLEMAAIGGWHYTRLVPLGGKERPAPPAWLFGLLVRIVPPLRARVHNAVRAVRANKGMRLVRRWRAEWRLDLARESERLRSRELGHLSDDGLTAHIDEARRLLARGCELHFLLHGCHVMVLGRLVFTCRALLGWDDQGTLRLLSGLSTMSTAPTRRLEELARMARPRPHIRNLLTDPMWQPVMGELAKLDAEFARALGDFQSDYGHRVLSYDLADPTLAEDLRLTVRLIADRLTSLESSRTAVAVAADQREIAVAEARAALADRPEADRQRFESALADAAEAYPVREENVFYTLGVPLALIRYAAQELGRRLSDRGQIPGPTDVFQLEIDEALGALKRGSTRRDLVGRREREQAWARLNPGPASYGRDPGPPPSFAVLPAEARFIHEAFEWYRDRIFAIDQPAAPPPLAGVLHGVAASPGSYTGHVRRVMDETEFDAVQLGDVLVSPTTSPVWSVVFSRIGALITDTGGVLSHPAIIAREYGIPAVVATGRATATLKTGDLVTVNGTAGVVQSH